MKRAMIFTLIIVLAAVSCAKKAEQPVEEAAMPDNPFFSAYGTPFETPPFDRIKVEHFRPAFDEGIRRQRAEVEAIAATAEEPTFANSVEALDRSGELLTRVDNVFSNLHEADTSDALDAVAEEVTPLLAKHTSDILLNEALFARIKAVYDRKGELGLGEEQATLLKKTYKDFVRGGANLGAAGKARLREIIEQLSTLSLQFGANVLKEDNGFALVIDSEEDLAGLPDNVISGAAEAAEERGQEGKWVFTLHKPSLIPFLQYSEKRELREKIFKAFINRGNNGNEYDNKAIASRMAALRVERAHLLGYPTHAHYVLEENMAKQPDNVFSFLNQIWVPSLEMAKKEAAEFQAMIDGEGGGFKLQPWDWWFYAEKVKKAKYEFDEEVLRPYFKLENVIDGAFTVAGKLWGLRFEERTDIPKYNPDVRVFEVMEADGTHVGILYTDYFPRSNKRGGAWSSAFRKQVRIDGRKVTPVLVNCGNFAKPTGGQPALLTIDHVRTLFHEFGHALHGLLSDCTYDRVSGTAVPRDFVELPSQIMENWAIHPDVLVLYARHYETGETIPQELVDKMRRAELFNQGFATVELLAASFLDMDWHTLGETVETDCLEFEKASLDRIGLIPEIVVRYRSPYFSHIFAGGYSSGYYSYIWAEVLDADAFEAFKEAGLFDAATARSFRENILSRGGTADPMVLYKRFRGFEPKVDALLRRKGFGVS